MFPYCQNLIPPTSNENKFALTHLCKRKPTSHAYTNKKRLQVRTYMHEHEVDAKLWKVSIFLNYLNNSYVLLLVVLLLQLLLLLL